MKLPLGPLPSTKKHLLLSLGACMSSLLVAQDMPEKNKAAYLAKLEHIDSVIAAGPFKADWTSLEKHEAAPEWFLDGKLGIYFHWGIYTVAEGHEWHIQKMHDVPRTKEYHEQKFGPVNEYPYDKLVEKFDGTHFDAEEWARLFKSSGAKFAGPVAIHHDTFAMWDSEITPWNSVNYGPKKDITGQLEKAIKAQGMKFLVTMHNDRSQCFIPRPPGSPNVSTDPEMRMRYANYSVEDYSKIFLTTAAELVEKYQPDMLWFDDGMIYIQPDTIHEKLLAFYFNTAAKSGRDVIVNTKKYQYPPSIAVIDHERSSSSQLVSEPWLTDDFIGSGWMYRVPFKVRPIEEILFGFIDIISKNGCLLFNISPTTDGRITDDQRALLKDLGDWLQTNGEAVYNTRPWVAFGEGPKSEVKSKKAIATTAADSKKAKEELTYSSQDLRYTTSKDKSTLYAIVMGWNKDISLNFVKANNPNGKVELLGYGPVDYTVNSNGQIKVTYPDLPEDKRPCKYAYSFKLTGFDATLQPSVDKSWQMVQLPENPTAKESVVGMKVGDAEPKNWIKTK